MGDRHITPTTGIHKHLLYTATTEQPQLSQPHVLKLLEIDRGCIDWYITALCHLYSISVLYAGKLTPDNFQLSYTYMVTYHLYVASIISYLNIWTRGQLKSSYKAKSVMYGL